MDVRLFIKRNAPTILTCLGAVGVVATAVMAVKETPKALTLLENAKKEKGEELTKFEKVKVAGPVYIPSVITGAATIACIFGSNVISKNQQATLISAYALLDNSYKEYKKKTDELYGEEAGKQIRGEIAKDKYTGDEVSLDDDKELFYDFYSGRYFESTKQEVLWAQYETNRSMFVNYSVGVNEYYDLLGLEPLPEYEMLGWTCGQIEEMYWHPWIEFDNEETVIEPDSEYNEGMKCTIIHMPFEPFIDYLEY
jgi:hypothetical protein